MSFIWSSIFFFFDRWRIIWNDTLSNFAFVQLQKIVILSEFRRDFELFSFGIQSLGLAFGPFGHVTHANVTHTWTEDKLSLLLRTLPASFQSSESHRIRQTIQKLIRTSLLWIRKKMWIFKDENLENFEFSKKWILKKVNFRKNDFGRMWILKKINS